MAIGLFSSIVLAGCNSSSDSGASSNSGSKSSSNSSPTSTPTSPSTSTFPPPPEPAPPANHLAKIAPPPMGWSSWNGLQNQVNFPTMIAETDALVALNARITSGPKYSSVDLDEGWWTSGLRDANGNFVVNDPNPATQQIQGQMQWPTGLKSLADYVHSKGMKAGIYISPAPVSCGSRRDGTNFPGSGPQFYDGDLLQFAEWGFDTLKIDFCSGVSGYSSQQLLTLMAQARQKAYERTGHWIDLETSTLANAWTFAPGLAWMWRTTGDLFWADNGDIASFDVPAQKSGGCVLCNFWGNYHPEFQNTGSYDNPDMMVAGLPTITDLQNVAHASLWAMAGGPMILGNDLRKPMSAAATTAVTNPEIIGIDQDGLGLQALMVSQNGIQYPTGTQQQVWAKLLATPGQRAVLFLNHTASDSAMKVTWQQLGLAAGKPATIRDVWAHFDVGTATDSYTVPIVPAGGVVVITLSGTDDPTTTYTPSHIGGGAKSVNCPICDGNTKVTELGSVTFDGVMSSNIGGYIQIAYLNSGATTLKANLLLNSNGAGDIVSFPPTGNTYGVITVYTALASGSNLISIVAVDPATTPGFQTPPLELISLRTVPGPVKTPPFKAAYEAEYGTRGGQAGFESCAACSGGQEVNYLGSTGTLTFTGVSAPADGSYDVIVSFANGIGPFTTLVYVNGGTTPVSVTFPPTGGWETPALMTITVPLNQGGSNNLKFVNAPNLDGIGSPTPH
jgi:alpha-galactosidase